ncbi:50S ribosomal protein L24 [Buchnera aphidicola]|uniref:Large ribosomal subunit protein uL24 n=1 Tax=Buchnera aphidicola (Cinara laricifoliae) TaxID=2518977 RepID=A0A451DBV3_9GAMM|nr:50S ribosomal protein L24 [Buchnera aphidicola]VFP83813.1 50S ribosomal protein L24 [Buchnera aphidicola (Cinara laricifoliae)]
MAAKIHLNDVVIILTGRDKGKIGIVKKIYRSNNMLIVQGINMVKKHQKAIPERQQIGGIIVKESPIHISNVSIFNQKTNKMDKIEFFWVSGKKIRRYKSTHEELLK